MLFFVIILSIFIFITFLFICCALKLSGKISKEEKDK
jgi:hypothetical protein